MTQPFFITTPIYYVNDVPHIGHAYTSLACDVMARFMRLEGREVFFLTGTDEHGQKVEKSAEAAGVAPKSFTDRVSARFRELTEAMGFSNNDFIRTTEARHIHAVQAFWNKLVEKEEIYLGSYAGWYSVRDEAYYAESELIEGKAPTGAPVEWVEEPSYFFRLSAWQDRLLAFYEANPDCILPESRRNEVISFVKSGLKDLSVSRTSFAWGIPVPNDPKHVVYVWLDALVNYATAAGYASDEARFASLWPADIHMVGKDILRFHAVYWPAFLMAADLPPPARVVAHGWWTNEGQKISKSLGNVIDPLELIESYGLDAVRYYLMREVPFGNDGNFTRSTMIHRINSELSNNVGNLAQRTLSMIQKNLEGVVPQPEAFMAEDEALFAACDQMIAELRRAMDRQQFHAGLEAIMGLGSKANLYIDQMEPWKLKKTDPDRMATVLYTLTEAIRHLALALLPYIPGSASRMLDQLAIPEGARHYGCVGAAHRLTPGTALPAPEGVFPRYQEQEIPHEAA
jgi:methionyl-tRNA synthetase